MVFCLLSPFRSLRRSPRPLAGTMLKWTVNKRTEPSATDSIAIVVNQTHTKNALHSRRSLGTLHRPANKKRDVRRKSLGSAEITKRIHYRDKENQHIATPHPHNFRLNATSTPSQKSEFALRDVRNLTPSNGMTPNTTPSRKRPLPKTPPPSPTTAPRLYASTLPTFQLEYSPCGPSIQPISMIPLGTQITDSYFNNPRYINHARTQTHNNDEESMPAPPVSKRLKYSPPPPPGMTPLSTRLSELRFSKISFKRTSQRSKKATKTKNENNNNNNGPQTVPSIDESLSSSALNDTALERMIDAIIESAKKEKNSFVRSITSRKSSQSNKHQQNDSNLNFGSPTYTAAEDPASDLNLFCDKFLISPEKVFNTAAERTIIIEDMEVINEREVRTPEIIDKPDDNSNKTGNDQEALAAVIETENGGSCHLRRQKAVRRKNTKIESSAPVGKKSAPNKATKIDATASDVASPETPTDENLFVTSFFKKNIDELACMNTPTTTLTEPDASHSNNVPQCVITSITSKISYESTPGIHSNDLQASSTPTGSQATASIRRCLNFSDSPPSESLDNDSLEKRKSTASSIVSSTSSRCFSTATIVSGSLDVAIFVENNKFNVHGELLV